MNTAELIAVGSELLTPYRQDTNTLWLTERLNAVGVRVTRKGIVGDDRLALATFFRAAGERASMVIACGGLGPTFDDITKEALADALNLKFEFSDEIYEWIIERYRARGVEPFENLRGQAMVPEGAQYFRNTVGTAPGLLIRVGDCLYALLPGPPAELHAVFEAMEKELFSDIEGEPVYRREFKLVGIAESAIDEKLKGFPLPAGMEWSILASYGQVEIHFSLQTTNEKEATEAFTAIGERLNHLFGNSIFGFAGDTLEAVVGDRLRESGYTVAVAESCTGGWLGRRLTDVPGSSDYFITSVVCYSNEAKMKILGVSPETIERHGAVSIEVAREMVRGVRELSGADVCVSITGIAGPGGGTPEKPVGLVYIGAIAPNGSENCYPFLFPGDREKIRYQATQLALAIVRAICIDEKFDSFYIWKR